MAKDPYKILGVDKGADTARIKAAYRELAKKYHPDLNPDNKEASKKFNDISAAYNLLNEPEKRAAFDRGEIDLDGNPKQQQYYRDFANQGQAGRYYQFESNIDPGDLGGIFSSFFGAKAGGRGGANPFETRPSTTQYELQIDFLEAAKGGKKRITLPDGKIIDVTIPEGIDNGQKLKLKGQGDQGTDAVVKINVRPHAVFTRKDKDIYIELPVGIHESVLGLKVKVPTIHGTIETSVPKGAQSGTTLRLKGKGVKGGDQLVRLKVTMPDKIDVELENFMSEWSRKHGYNPRKSSGAQRA